MQSSTVLNPLEIARQTPLETLSYSQLTGLFDALEAERRELEKVISRVEAEIGYIEWERDL